MENNLDYSAQTFMAKFDASKTTLERRQMLSAVLNKLSHQQINAAIYESQRPIHLLSPKERVRLRLGPRPYTGVAVIIVADGMFALHKRISSIGHGHGEWSLVGGHQEHGQSLEEAAAMELKEEVNLEAESFEFLDISSTFITSTGRHYNTVYFIARGVHGECQNREPDKSEGLFLFNWKKWPKPMWSPALECIKRNSRALSHIVSSSKTTSIKGLVPHQQPIFSGVE